MKNRFMALSIAVLACLGSPAFASVSDDQVTSQKIREADGTSGQNTNSGSGVKTGHIQDGAVTTSKIAVSAVTSSVIAGAAVTTATIADGAVTDAKIVGPISASKISSIGLSADTVDGLHASDLASAVHSHSQSDVSGLPVALAGKADVLHNHDLLYQQKYGKVAVVAQRGGDYADPVSAMNDVSTWCGTPTAANLCLLKIMPGVYDIGAASLQMAAYIDVEGAGESSTTIISSVPGAMTGTIVGASDMEMRFFSVKNVSADGANTMNNAIFNSAASPAIHKVTAVCSGGQYCCGVRNEAASAPILTQMTSVATINASNSYGAFGIFNAGGAAPFMRDVRATGSTGGRYSVGVINTASNPLMSDVEATGNGLPGMSNNMSVGVWNQACSSPVMLLHVKATASGAAGENDGIYNYQSSVTAMNVRSTGSGPNSKGLLTVSPGNISMDHSVLQGATASVNNGGSTVFVGNSKLDGALVRSSGTTKCIGTYDGNYDPVVCP